MLIGLLAKVFDKILAFNLKYIAESFYLGCATSSCSQSSLLACGQWTVCPNSGCTLTPQISSNSWGGGRGQDWFDNVMYSIILPSNKKL